jgi:hypothetical protein
MVSVTRTADGPTVVLSELNLRHILANFERDGYVVYGRPGNGAVIVESDAEHYRGRTSARLIHAREDEKNAHERFLQAHRAVANGGDHAAQVELRNASVAWDHAARLLASAESDARAEREATAAPQLRGALVKQTVRVGDPAAVLPGESGMDYVNRRMRADLY